jgi:uncharacterized protein
MQKTLSLAMLPHQAVDEKTVLEEIARALSINPATVNGYTIVKQSIDARGKQPRIQISLIVFIEEPVIPRETIPFSFRDTHKADRKVIIVGAGPAGLFAALYFLRSGIQPIILERGKDVRARRRDLAILNKAGIVNPESNYCFGEGGAGTYSDGKLYTRSSKRGNVKRILNLLVYFGADEKILYESHPHIGTNKLPGIITAMREKIEDCGGRFLFNKKVTDFELRDNRIVSVTTEDGDSFQGDAVILATGHSARDIFQLLHNKKIRVEQKPFALGVRVEHPQSLIDAAQYHSPARSKYLPPASYSLVQQINGKGVFSFCMCPGGIIAPASTSPGEIVVNGWSPSKRNNPYANSGIVVTVEANDVISEKPLMNQFREAGLKPEDPLLLLAFQRSVEQHAFICGGANLVAPAQRLIDFTKNKVSADLPACSYLPGLNPFSLKDVLPSFIHTPLQLAFKEFGKKIKGYLTNEAVVVATESRTSSPVRIPRDPEQLHHPQISNLYPCGEGAGYAGGIVSAAMDGEKVAEIITES